MAASVLFACGLNEQKLPPFIHISEESHIDGSFLISCILGQRLRTSNAGTLLVCLQHNYNHYFNAGMRLGYNTNIFRDKTLHVIDPLTDIANQYPAHKWLTDSDQMTTLLLDAIRAQLAETYPNRASTTLLIDNLSILMNLGASREQIHQLCHELATLTKEHANLTIVTKLSNCDLYPVADQNVAKLSDVKIRVVKLKSGVFREVDGKLIIDRDDLIAGGPLSLSGADEKNANEDAASAFEREQKHKEVLYKVNDRNVKIFTPGEVGVKV